MFVLLCCNGFSRYFFYKNFAFTLCHFWYAFFCGFSAQVRHVNTGVETFKTVVYILQVILKNIHLCITNGVG